VIERLQRTLLAAIGRPRRPMTAAATAIPRTRHTKTRTDMDRRVDAARQRLKATIPPPAE
jgi:hypothetical protein